MDCRACGRLERASEGYPCTTCGTFMCMICTFQGVSQCAKCRGLPNRWFTKIRPVRMKVVYKPDEKDSSKSVMEIWYDIDADDPLFDEPPINTHEVPRRSGYVGFAWTAMMFKARGLKISGKLDKPAALRLIREKLGVPQGEPSKKAGENGRTRERELREY